MSIKLIFLHAQDFLEKLSQQGPEKENVLLLKNLLPLSYPMSCNFIAQDNLFTQHPHYLKDASNPMAFSHIQFGDENALCFSGAAPP